MPATEQITIQKRTFNVPNPYEEGHQITAGEAGALNQVFHENVRNNLAKKISELDDAAAQAAVDAYVESYKFGERTGGGGGPRDPVKVEAMRIARELVKKAILKAGRKIEDFGAKAISERAAVELEKHPEWTEQAKERVAAMRETADASLAGIEIAA